MLPPLLDALTFLHDNQLVQGQLKPSNVLVIDDQVKLASDTIQAAGAAVPGIVRSSVYDAPETASGHRLPAGDMWALGITMVQALTQRLPTWPDGRSQNPVLPEGFPRDFGDLVLSCLHQNPTERPTPQELKAQISGEITAPLAVLPEPVAVVPEPPAPQKTVVSKKPVRQEPVLSEPARAEIVSRAVAAATAPQTVRETPKRSITPLVAGAIIGLLVVWGWSHWFQKPHHPSPAVANDVQPAAPSAPPTQQAAVMAAPASKTSLPRRTRPASRRAPPGITHCRAQRE